MKHYFYFLLIILFAGRTLCVAQVLQQPGPEDVLLTGTVLMPKAWDKKKRIQVTIYIATFAANITAAPTTKYVVDVDSNNYFKLVIPSPAKRFYMHLGFAPDGGTFIDQIYLLEQGDRLQCSLAKGNFSFTGKGAAKLNCQSLIYQTRYKGTKTISSYAKSGDWNKVFATKVLQQDSLLQARLAIVETFRPVIGADLANIMRANCYGLSYFTLLRTERITSSLPGRLAFFANNTIFEKLLPVPILDTISMLASPNYTDFLFEKILINYFVKNDGRLIRNDANLNKIYNQIKSDYSGILREKLLVLFFLNFKDNLPLNGFFPDALLSIRKSDYKALVLDVQRKKMVGQTFFPFEMQDDKGKWIKLSDFKDKVLLIDFWFTGCSACKLLNTAMAPVVAEFINNPRVKFLSISIDEDKNKWLSSIQSKAYTHNESINLYAGGQSSSSVDLHPLLKAYDISIFPTMFLLRDNKVLELTPPRPSAADHGDPEGGNTMKLIQLIKNALTEGG